MNGEVERLEKEIASLPRGYISNKMIGGKIRHYLQWNENGKIKSRYIPDAEFEEIKEGIERRKILQKELKAQMKKMPDYEMNVITGTNLKSLVKSVEGWRKRECYSKIITYLYGRVTPRVCAVYGLRRTGKTTMLYQAIAEMSKEDFLKTAYIKAQKKQSMSMLAHDMKLLHENGYRFIFLDEITLLDDFIDTASFLSDIYAAMGMKIVLSGTDSLGIWFASREELYDRTYTVHTTWIPYSEHAMLLGIDDVDEYIRYGGTLRVGETDFDDPELQSEEVSFRDDESTRRYIDTAICGNIQHSLKCYENGNYFRHLQELYDSHELTGAINRIIESMNHRFVLSVLNDDFVSNDLKMSKKNLLREKNPEFRTDILERIDAKQVTNRLMNILKIQNRTDRQVPVTETHIFEIKEYLKALDLIVDCPIRYDNPNAEERENILFTQPGMRFCQAQALVFSLMKDEMFSALDEIEKDHVCTRILDEVKGRMLEEIVLLETMKRLSRKYDVFKLQFMQGEFDMVVYDKEKHGCRIYEIKHSRIAVPEQYKHLNDNEKCSAVERRFGKIEGRYVLYRGESHFEGEDIIYMNVSEFLKRIPDLFF